MLGKHLLIPFVAGIMGIGLGGSFGYGCDLITRSIVNTSTIARQPIILFPWRTIVISLPLLSPFMPVLIGLKTIAGIVMIGIFVFVLAWLLPLPPCLIIGSLRCLCDAFLLELEDLQCLTHLLTQLVEERQELLLLRFSAGLSFAQIGLLDGHTEAAVKMAIYRANCFLDEHSVRENG